MCKKVIAGPYPGRCGTHGGLGAFIRVVRPDSRHRCGRSSHGDRSGDHAIAVLHEGLDRIRSHAAVEVEPPRRMSDPADCHERHGRASWSGSRR